MGGPQLLNLIRIPYFLFLCWGDVLITSETMSKAVVPQSFPSSCDWPTIQVPMIYQLMYDEREKDIESRSGT